jgi:hypothetical protein
MFGNGIQPFKEPTSPLAPPVCDGQLTSKVDVIVGYPDRHPGSPAPIAPGLVQAVGALARVKGDRSVAEPPGRPTQAFQSLRRLLPLQCRLKVGAGLLPSRPRQSFLAGLERRGRLRCKFGRVSIGSVSAAASSTSRRSRVTSVLSLATCSLSHILILCIPAHP